MFYSDQVFELTLGDDENILDVKHIGVVADADELNRLGLPAEGVSKSRPADPDVDRASYRDMYFWAERNWPALADLGFTGVMLKQEHADYREGVPIVSLLFWGSPGDP